MPNPTITLTAPGSNDPLRGFCLGDRARDVLTGFTGVITATARYLTGCNQCCLTPDADAGLKASKLPDSHWFDVERLELLDKSIVDVRHATPTGRDLPQPAAR